MDDLAPGRSLLRRDDPARAAARLSRLGQRDVPPAGDADPLVPRVPPQRRTDLELGLLNGARRALRGDDQESAIRGRATVAEPVRPGENRPAETRPAETRPAETRPAENRLAESRPGENRPAQNRAAENRAADSRVAETRPAESRAAGTRSVETRPGDGRQTEARPAEARPVGSRAAEARAVPRPAESRLKALRPASTRRAEPAPPPEEARPVRRTLAGEPEFVRRVNPFELPDPRGYSHATVARGQIVFVAGQTGVDLDGRIVDGGMVKQFDRAVQNLLTALAAAGGSPEQLASVTVQVTSIDEYKANSRPIGHVWRARLGGGLPALSLIEVRRFWNSDALVQIEGHAVLP